MKTKVFSVVVVCLLTTVLFSCAKTPEGIPIDLLTDKDAAMAIVFYRDYLASATVATLTRVHEGKTDDAIGIQEFILDEIIAEVGPDLSKFSQAQRKIAVDILNKIQEYHSRHPRSESKWYQALPPDQKENYAKVDTLLDEAVIKAPAQAPDGEFAGHKPIQPILLLRGYMVDAAIVTLSDIRMGRTVAMTRRLNNILDQLILVCGPQMEQLSYDGQERAAEMFAKIKHYRDKYTRDGDLISGAGQAARHQHDEVSAMLDRITAKYEAHGVQPFFGVE
jgi:hypothetical protein